MTKTGASMVGQNSMRMMTLDVMAGCHICGYAVVVSVVILHDC
jgi:hypothetical protein